MGGYATVDPADPNKKRLADILAQMSQPDEGLSFDQSAPVQPSKPFLVPTPKAIAPDPSAAKPFTAPSDTGTMGAPGRAASAPPTRTTDTLGPRPTPQYQRPEIPLWKSLLGSLATAVPIVGPAINTRLTQRPFAQAQSDYQNQVQQANTYDKNFADQEKEKEFTQKQGDTETRNAAFNQYHQDQLAALENSKRGAPAERTVQGPDGPEIEDWNGKAWVSTGKAFVKPEKATRPDAPEQQFIDEFQTKHPGTGVSDAVAAYARTAQAPQRDPQQMGIGPDGKVFTLRPGATVPVGTKSGSAYLKGPTADEERRADLARNMNENLDQLEGIVKAKPELFGPLAGRMTQLKGFIGTNDPDVAALNTLKEQMGMAMVGAHSMRNAQHVEAAANSILNGFKNSPDALLNAIQQARKSLTTFQEDAGEQPGSAPKGKPFKQSAPSGAKSDPLGIL